MKVTCPDCKTCHHTDAKYCDACGYQFWTDPVRMVSKQRVPTHYRAAILAGIIAAVFRYVVLG